MRDDTRNPDTMTPSLSREALEAGTRKAPASDALGSPESARRERVERGLDEAFEALRGVTVEVALARLAEAVGLARLQARLPTASETDDNRNDRRARLLCELGLAQSRLINTAETVGHLTRELKLLTERRAASSGRCLGCGRHVTSASVWCTAVCKDRNEDPTTSGRGRAAS